MFYSQTLGTLIGKGFSNVQIPAISVVVVLLMSMLLSMYEYVVYRFVSKRSFYSKQFNITMAVLPLFISTIILTLQSNLLITLGTIGALAIIRFRTAIKDPIDMVYLLWSIHTGIVCGCGLYEVGVLTSLAATIFLIVLELLPVQNAPYLLVLNATLDAEQEIMNAIKKYADRIKVKSRNITMRGCDYVIELRTKKEKEMLGEISGMESVKSLSLVAYDGENFT